MGRLDNKVCIITGAAGGQGEVAVELFAREGARILASDLAPQASARIAKVAAEHPGRVHYVAGDVTHGADLDAIVAGAVERFGRIDVLFNNHGVMVGSPFLDTTEAQLEQVLSINVRASFVLAHASATALVARLSTLYGPGQSRGKPQGLIAHIARGVVRNQPVRIYVPLDTVRDYLAADDAAAATELIVHTENTDTANSLFMIHSLRSGQRRQN